MQNLPLFPRPRHVDSHDPTAAVRAAPTFHHDASLPDQGYSLTVEDDSIGVTHADDAGRRYAAATLAALRRPDGSYPGVRIRDWPDFAHRSYLLDVSRDRVPTRATLALLVERLAACRYNQLQCYVEHTFAHPAHRTVWEDASPLTPDDLAWLDATCAAAGIELVANQNTFGHFERWLAHDAYRHRAECPDGFELVPGFRQPPSVLAPTSDNAAFVLDLVRAQLECVTSRTVNIGCDETFELGHGVSATDASGRGVGAVYAEHVRRIAAPLIDDDGVHVQFWADVVRTHPAVLDSLPTDRCTPLVWNYDAPDLVRPEVPGALVDVLATIGIDPDAPTDFATILEPFAAADGPFWVAPGTSTWQSFVGRFPNARANLADAAVAGVAAGAHGFLVTDWGDRGHHQPPAVSLPPVVYGGAVAWCAATNTDLDVAPVVDRLVGDATGTFGSTLTAIGSVDGATGVTARNASPLFQAVVPSRSQFASGEPDADAVTAVIATLDEARADLALARPSAADATALLEGTDVAIGLARHGARRLAARAGGPPLDPGAAAAEMEELITAHRAAWLQVSRPGGLADSVAHLAKRRDRYRAAI